jgi:hypothetical protein
MRKRVALGPLQTFERDNRLGFEALGRLRAGDACLAVYDYCAGAAVAFGLAAVFSGAQAQQVTEHVEQGVVGTRLDLFCAAIDVERYLLHCRPSRARGSAA